MFKSIQWKVLTVFVLLIISVMIVVGTFLLNSISTFYHEEFKTQMEQMVFTADFVGQLEGAAASGEPVEAMGLLLDVYAGRIGVDSYRNYYILDSATAQVFRSSEPNSAAGISLTQNVLNAMAGQVGNVVSRSAELMDYAYPIESYVIYVSDSKNELYGILGSIFNIIFWALFLGLIISVFLGLFLSRTIMSPIASLKKRAEKIALGDFEQKLEVRSRDEIGQLTGTFNIMASELSQTLSEIAREKTKIETILRFMSDAVLAFDQDGRAMHINPAANSMLDIEEENIEFDSFFERLNINITLAELLYLEQYKTIEKQTEHGDRVIKAHFAPFISASKRADGVVVVIQDITEQQRLDIARREFVANVSHELRTPLTTVKSYAETLRENAEPDSMEANFLNVIDNETDRMTRLVKDLLTLSLLDYDKKVLHKTTFALDSLVEAIVAKQGIEAAKNKQTLSFTKSEGMPLFFGDKDRVEQVIINIVTNAVKYTPEHGVIKVSCEHRLPDAIITVEDSGIGIPKADIPHLFDRFYRVDKARSRKHGGTGLGLAIAKEIVDAHSGTISVSSAHGKGTTVTVKMPFFSN